MDLSNDDLERIAAAHRRALEPPIQVDSAAWSKAGQLEWWVKDRQQWWGRVRGADGRHGGSELLICVRPGRRDRQKAVTPAPANLLIATC